MKLELFFLLCCLLCVAFYCPVESKKKTDNCLPKDAAKKTEARKMMPTITTMRNMAHRSRESLFSMEDNAEDESNK